MGTQSFCIVTMPPKKEVKKVPDKLTDSEKKKIKQENKAKANPELAAGKKEKSDAKRERRKESGSTKSFAQTRSDLGTWNHSLTQITHIVHCDACDRKSAGEGLSFCQE